MEAPAPAPALDLASISPPEPAASETCLLALSFPAEPASRWCRSERREHRVSAELKPEKVEPVDRLPRRAEAGRRRTAASGLVSQESRRRRVARPPAESLENQTAETSEAVVLAVRIWEITPAPAEERRQPLPGLISADSSRRSRRLEGWVLRPARRCFSRSRAIPSSACRMPGRPQVASRAARERPSQRPAAAKKPPSRPWQRSRRLPRRPAGAGVDCPGASQAPLLRARPTASPSPPFSADCCPPGSVERCGRIRRLQDKTAVARSAMEKKRCRRHPRCRLESRRGRGALV